ncbi:hypothetical protein CFE70_008586 [Pyrenophora teres f. teres 0-1]|uniref:Uncharacterized protein n=1 Tax=Pyrenophora teres f. teres TaxID=97479 RepID=A0A6S6WB24_9PLEO|nr:hypothetical protein HRS9139_05770 [Pyrenophora teres f. teres]CAA9965701.1 hypothetical protein PTMSG1_09060 [Pyrenophora teres f. maculata]KAE8835736.1 hypothetical protein HRS9122_08006 [Pyrenophora teres f. teres]KAE8858638.1 hypothetical protein PTNB29_07853 [Pyrenophora teres f. teres]KAE8861521.1 hypothetical protein PTNB73_07075 [Pyrenophora teres f. teres]
MESQQILSRRSSLELTVDPRLSGAYCVPPSTPVLPRPAAWDYLSQRVFNLSNTYHTYAIIESGGLVRGQGTTEGERFYILQPDGTLLWAPLVHLDPLVLAEDPALPQMVADTGGNPELFPTRQAMADHMLLTEQPVRALRPDDRLEMSAGGASLVGGLGPSASDCFWGVGQSANGVVTFELLG